MIKKEEAETAIRHLAIEWAAEIGYVAKPGHYASFADFCAWLETKHYSHYLNFRSQTEPRHVAEGWFEAELRIWSTTRQT